jgi:(p)ppGpp synthase/HD superfamily hydrolase
VNSLERAIAIAVEGHRGQRDKAGQPYVLHPLRMMLRQRGEAEMMAAVLHDVVEDAGWTLERLAQEGMPPEVVEAVDCLTRRASETYEEFVERVKPNPIARAVKLADLEDNMNLTRINAPADKDWERMQRYHRAWHVLTAAEAEARAAR